MRVLHYCLASLIFANAAARAAAAQTSDGPVLFARGLEPTATFNVFNSAGSVRIVAWDRDSIVVRSRVNRRDVAFGGDRKGGKLWIENSRRADTTTPADLVIYYPRHGAVNIKTAAGDITAVGVAGQYSAVSGTIHVSGSVSSVEAEAMSGNIDLEVTTPWARARTGEGRLLVRGEPQDVDVSTISGTLDVASGSILRGRFASVTGDIRYAAEPRAGALFEFSDHAGTVDFLLARDVSGRFDLSTITGEIANGFTSVRPVAAGPHSLRLNLGRGDAQFTVRTFKGTIRVRQR